MKPRQRDVRPLSSLLSQIYISYTYLNISVVYIYICGCNTLTNHRLHSAHTCRSVYCINTLISIKHLYENCRADCYRIYRPRMDRRRFLKIVRRLWISVDEGHVVLRQTRVEEADLEQRPCFASRILLVHNKCTQHPKPTVSCCKLMAIIIII